MQHSMQYFRPLAGAEDIFADTMTDQLGVERGAPRRSRHTPCLRSRQRLDAHVAQAVSQQRRVAEPQRPAVLGHLGVWAPGPPRERPRESAPAARLAFVGVLLTSTPNRIRHTYILNSTDRFWSICDATADFPSRPVRLGRTACARQPAATASFQTPPAEPVTITGQVEHHSGTGRPSPPALLPRDICQHAACRRPSAGPKPTPCRWHSASRSSPTETRRSTTRPGAKAGRARIEAFGGSGLDAGTRVRQHGHPAASRRSSARDAARCSGG